MGVLELVERALVGFANFVWGVPILVLLLGGGLFFFLYSRFWPYQYMRHALHILRGDYDDPREAGDLPHFQALASALSATLGMGNIAGVAVAIQVGGPGAVFWMWVTALLGIATKFFTCTLAIMYRGRDSLGRVQGGPMYVVTEGLGPRWRPLAVLFCVAGLFGTLPAFQINQLTQAVRDVVVIGQGWLSPEADPFWFDFGFGCAAAALVATVIFGGITRIGAVAARAIPFVVVLYLAVVLWILLAHLPEIPAHLALIVRDAFTGEAVAGGAFGHVIVTGVRRGIFSNEAGVGTESMAHGAAQTNEPVREGLVAMLGPVVDTLIVCTCTALAILMTDVWRETEADGVTLTANAFGAAMPGFGPYLLTVIVLLFSITTMFTYWYYGTKCLGFLIGAEREHWYRYLYVALIVGGAVVSLEAVIGLIDGMFALMAIPTILSSVLLAPHVMDAAGSYFRRHDAGEIRTATGEAAATARRGRRRGKRGAGSR